MEKMSLSSKKSGKGQALEDEIESKEEVLDADATTEYHVGIGRTRQATHGVTSAVNAHLQQSDNDQAFCVIHYGIITNFKDIKAFLVSKGYDFESDTDTEFIAKLVFHMYKQHPNYSFRELVEQVVQQLDDDVAAVKEGLLVIHHLRRSVDDSLTREITAMIKMEI